MLYALKRHDGGVEIMQVVQQPDGSYPKPQDCIAKWSDERKADLTGEIVQIEPQDVPSDRTYRNALAHDGKTFSHDMVKARTIHKEMLRVARAPAFAILDIAYQRADEDGNSTAKAAVVLQKQRLRDLTADSAIDAARTVDELMAAWPAELIAELRKD